MRKKNVSRKREKKNFIRPNPKHCRRPFLILSLGFLMFWWNRTFENLFFLQYARLNYRFSQSRHYSQQSSFKISETPKKKYFPWRPKKFFFSFFLLLYVNHRQKKRLLDLKLYENFSLNFASVFCSFSSMQSMDHKKNESKVLQDPRGWIREGIRRKKCYCNGSSSSNI